MYTGQIAEISNKASWASDVCELVDIEDGTTTDLTDPALTVDIVVTITDKDDRTNTLATASIANGKVSIPGPGFSWQFEVSDLTNIDPGIYGIGVKVTINDFVNDVIAGTLAIVEGN